MAVMENWVVLVPGVKKRLHLIDHAFQERSITDTIFRGSKTVRDSDWGSS